MRLIRARIKNFGSYRELEFSYENLGLALIYGATGSGKSTLADIAPWVLFSKTAKDGSVDEVRSWDALEATEGHLTIDLNGQLLTITRIRGKGQNDLYWNLGSAGDSCDNRGKDLLDTQRLISRLLGFDGDTYLAATYFSEFSDIGLFFSLRAKERRTVLEKICDTITADTLGNRSSLDRKRTKEEIAISEKEIAKIQGVISQLERSIESTKSSRLSWEEAQKRKIEEVTLKAKTFTANNLEELSIYRDRSSIWAKNNSEDIGRASIGIAHLRATLETFADPKEEIATIQECISIYNNRKCSECGGPKASSEVQSLYNKINELNKQSYKICTVYEQIKEQNKRLDQLEAAQNPHMDIIKRLESAENTYKEQLVELKTQNNPYHVLAAESELYQALNSLDNEVRHNERLVTYQSQLDILYDLSSSLRGVIIQKAISQLEHNVNGYLETYFDNEITVKFSLKADAVDVAIQKSGHTCAYTQLSRGQRSLLRLCFVVAIQKAIADASGQSFSTLMYDEVLDGLDSGLKIKAYALMESLLTRAETILCIDHATDFQNLFETKFQVSLVGDESQVEQS
jgi:DNA repair exonuclease SbcCD ATPase subunit